MQRKRLLRWVGALAGVPVIAAGYRAVMRRGDEDEPRLLVRLSVQPELVNDLADLVRSVRGRAALEGRDAFSVPVPDSVSPDSAYRELRALLDKWELSHPGFRVQITPMPDGKARQRLLTERAGVA